jgi:hypothetical protein
MAQQRQKCCIWGQLIIRYFGPKGLSRAERGLFFTEWLCKKMNKAKLGLNPEHNNTRVTWSACRDLEALPAPRTQVFPAFAATASHALSPARALCSQ